MIQTIVKEIHWIHRVNTDLLKDKKLHKDLFLKVARRLWFASRDSPVMICPLSKNGKRSVSISGSKCLPFKLILGENFFTIVSTWANYN